MRNRRIIVLSWVLLICVAGCDDESSSSGELGPDLSRRVAPGDMAIAIQSDSLIPTPVRDSAMMQIADGGVVSECVPGTTRCSAERADFEDYCRNDGRWTIRACDGEEICVGGGCVPDPLGCTPGSRICEPSTGEPAVCQGDQWVADVPCGEGQRCEDGQCLSEACAYAARTASYLGCDYLAVDLPNTAFLPNDGTTPDSPLGLVVANTSAADTVRVSVTTADGLPARMVGSMVISIPPIPDIIGRYQPQTVESRVVDGNGMVVARNFTSAAGLEIPPGGQATFLMPRRMGPVDSSSLRPDAFRLQTDFPVVVYQFSPYCCNYSFSNDASLLLPTAALGVKYRFLGVPVHMIRGPFGDVQEGGKAMAAVVSPKDNNRVTVQMPAGLVILPDSTGRVAQAGDSVEVNMDEQDVLLVMASGQSNQRDLSGALIESQYPVAVFSAHLCSYYPENLSACDHLQEQLFPMSTWGTSFQLVPPAERNRNWATEVIYWKFVAGDQVTRFQLGLPFNQLNAVSPGFELVSYCGNFLEGPDTFVLRPGQTCEFGTKRSVQVVSDQPAMVMGIIAGQEATGLLNFGSRAGDPAIFLVPPDQQYRRDYTFLAPDTYFRDYVTVVTTPGNEIQLDGQLVSLNDALPVGGSNFVFKHVALTDGPHQMTARSPFGIVVYAYDDFVSYAFTGGLNLTKR